MNDLLLDPVDCCAVRICSDILNIGHNCYNRT